MHFPLRWASRCSPFLAALLGAWLVAVPVTAQTPRRPVDLPAYTAEANLKLLATQTGVEVIFGPEMVAGLRTPALQGDFTPLEAARRVLAGTGLIPIQNPRTGGISITRAGAETPPTRPPAERSEPRRADTGTGTAEGDTGAISGRVSDATTGAYLVGAIATVGGTSLSATVDRDGGFEITGVPPGSGTVTLSYVGYSDATFPVTVAPGTTARLEARLAPTVIRLSAFVVEGAREGQARAINEQRSAINLRNIVAADAIGNFPDVNAAEALKRLPGISTVRQRGEDRDITIRGAAPNLNSITLDGVSVLSNQVDGRTVSLDVYPAEQLAGVEITKSAMPNQDADSIGGAINLRSKSAFDTGRRVLSANAFWQYNDLADQSSYRAGLNFSDVLGASRDWGVQFSASRAQRKALEETSEPAGWAVRSGTAANGAYTGYSPNNVAFTYVDIKRERTGGSAALERKFGDTARLFLRASHNEFIERNARPRFVVQNAGTIAAAQPVTVTDGRITVFTSTALRGQRVVNPRQFTDTGSSLALGGRAHAGPWQLELVGSLARGTNHQDSVTGQWQTGANTTGLVDFSDSERPRVTRSAGPDLNDAAAYSFSQLQIQDRRLRNRELSLKGDASRELRLAGTPLRFTTGFKHRWSPKRWDQENEQYNSIAPAAGGAFGLADSRAGGAYEVKRGFLDGLMDFGPTIVPYSFFDFVKANRAAFVPNGSGNLLTQTRMVDSSGSGGTRGSIIYSITLDASDNIYATGNINDGVGTGGGCIICKYDSSANLLWAKEYTPSNATSATYPGKGIAIDNLGNIYSIFYTNVNTQIILFKTDSTGVQQWVRYLDYASGNVSFDSRGAQNVLYIDSENNLRLCFDASNSTYSSTVVSAKLPTDGTKTGTYTVGPISITYSTVSFTLNEYTLLWTSQAAAGTQTTPTMVTLSNQMISYNAPDLSATTYI